MDFTYTKNVLLRLLTELLSDYTAEEIKEEIEFELEKIKMLEKKVIPVELRVKPEIADIIKQLREFLVSTPDKGRLHIFSEIMDGYCKHCGCVDNYIGGCQCWNDE